MPVPPTLVRTGLVVPTGMGVTTAHAPQDTKDEAAEWTLMNAELLVFVKMGANVLTLLVPFAVAALAALLANYVKFPTFHAHPHNAKMEAPADQLETSRTSVSAYQVRRWIRTCAPNNVVIKHWAALPFIMSFSALQVSKDQTAR